jgi:hypothetical protein
MGRYPINIRVKESLSLLIRTLKKYLIRIQNRTRIQNLLLHQRGQSPNEVDLD